MNEQLKQILEDLEYNKVFIKTIDGYDNKYLNEFNNWQFSKVYSFEHHKVITIITFESGYAWNEQIVESLMDIRKRCIAKYGYDIISLDADMCGAYFGYGNKLYNKFSENYINKLIHKFKIANIKPKYLLTYNLKDKLNVALIPLIKQDIYHGINKKQAYSLYYLYKYFMKKYKVSFKCWTYYDII